MLNWDRHGAIELCGIETNQCPKCESESPIVPMMSSLVAISRMYPGVRQFWYGEGDWTVSEWQKEWKLKTDLQVGDRVMLEDPDITGGEEEEIVIRIDGNSYGYDVLTLKPVKAGLGVPFQRSRNHNRCRKMGE